MVSLVGGFKVFVVPLLGEMIQFDYYFLKFVETTKDSINIYIYVYIYMHIYLFFFHHLVYSNRTSVSRCSRPSSTFFPTTVGSGGCEE